MPEILVKDSILQSTKKLVGIEADDDAYDLDIMTHINTAFATLYQAGVGPLDGFIVEDGISTWSQFIGNKMEIQGVKSFVFFSVKLAFDPPPNSFGLDNIKNQLTELIWRLNVAEDFSILPVTTEEEPPTVWVTGSSSDETPAVVDSDTPATIWSAS